MSALSGVPARAPTVEEMRAAWPDFDTTNGIVQIIVEGELPTDRPNQHVERIIETGKGFDGTKASLRSRIKLITTESIEPRKEEIEKTKKIIARKEAFYGDLNKPLTNKQTVNRFGKLIAKNTIRIPSVDPAMETAIRALKNAVAAEEAAIEPLERQVRNLEGTIKYIDSNFLPRVQEAAIRAGINLDGEQTWGAYLKSKKYLIAAVTIGIIAIGCIAMGKVPFIGAAGTTP